MIDSSSTPLTEAGLRAALAASEERARVAESRLAQAEEKLIHEENTVEQVGDMAAAATEKVLLLTKQNEAAQREVDRLRRDVVAYDSRIIALMNSEHRLQEEVTALRRRAVDRASDPEGLEDIARQARNTLTEADLDVLDAHRAALWDAGDTRVGEPLSMVLAVVTRLIRWKETP